MHRWMMISLVALGLVACTAPNDEFEPDDSEVTVDQFMEVACNAAGNNPGHLEAPGGTVPCIVRQCNAGAECDEASWLCSDEPPVEGWVCVADLPNGQPCKYRVQCATKACSLVPGSQNQRLCGTPEQVAHEASLCKPPVGRDGKPAVTHDGAPCGQWPSTYNKTECVPPMNAETCPAKAPCRSDDGCDSGVCDQGRCGGNGWDFPPEWPKP